METLTRAASLRVSRKNARIISADTTGNTGTHTPNDPVAIPFTSPYFVMAI